jgi:hypothetical protein
VNGGQVLHEHPGSYLEYFYFVMYFAVLAVAANSYAIAHKPPRWLAYEDNLVPRLLFWPAIVGVLFLVTMIFFY